MQNQTFPSAGGVPLSPQQAPTSLRFQEKAPYEKGFEAYFDERIKPVLKELDQERMKRVELVNKNTPKAKLIFWGCILLGVVLTYFWGNLFFLLLMWGVGWVIKKAMLATPGYELSVMFKSRVIPLIVKFFGDFQYQAQKDLESEIELLRSSGIFNNFNRSLAEDFISGEYKGNKFSFAEMHLWYHSGGRNSTSTDIFKGMVLFLENKNHCQGRTILKKDQEKGFWEKITGQVKGLKNFKLSDPQFENVFEAYTSDDNEARTFLTPDLLNRLLKLNQLYPDSGIRCAIFGKHLLITLPYGRMENAGKMFESLSARELVFDMEEIHKFLAQFNEILQVIDTITPKAKEF